MRGSSTSVRKPQMVKAPTIVSRAPSLRSVERQRVDCDPLRAAFESTTAAQAQSEVPPATTSSNKPSHRPQVSNRSDTTVMPPPPPSRPVAPEPQTTAETIAAELLKGLTEGRGYGARTLLRRTVSNPLVGLSSTGTTSSSSRSPRALPAGVLDLAPIRELVRRCEWAPALRRTQQAMAESPTSDSQKQELRLFEIRALLRLHRYADAQNTLKVMGIDAAKTSKDGSVAEDPSTNASSLPFALRALGAEMPYYCAKDVQATLTHLQRLLDELQRADAINAETREFLTAVSSAEAAGAPAIIIPMACELLLGPEAVRPLERLSPAQIFHWQIRLLALLATHSSTEAGGTQHSVMYCLRAARIADAAAASKRISASDRHAMVVDALCRAARLLAQAGNIEAAATLFRQLKEIVPPAVYDSPQMRVEQCNLLLANGKYAEVLEELEKVLSLPPDKLQQMVSGEPGLRNAPDDHSEILLVASNNIAIAALHCCEIRRAVECLEVFLRADIRRRMHPILIFNLCTLYEVAFEGHVSQMRKSALRIVAQRLNLQIPPSAFRL